MKKLIFFIVLLSMTAVFNAQTVKKVKTLKAGTLSTLLTKIDNTTLTDLTVSGVIDARDFVVIRSLEKLEHLDLNATKIAHYKGLGGTAYSDNDTTEYKADEIPELAFTSMTENSVANNLKTLILPNTLTSIGVLGITSCNKLTSVKCPKTLIKIYEMAFQDCTSLTEFEIGENVNYLGSQAFMRCSNLKTLIFNNLYADGLDANTFSGCFSLKSIYVNTPTPTKFNSGKDLFSIIEADKSNITVFIKSGTLQLFKQDPNWNVFPNIVEL